jgi:hypothetical protein
VNIRFTSSLTPEDESRLVPALLNAVAGFLEMLPIAYMIRIDTADSQVFQLSGPNTARSQASTGTGPGRSRATEAADDEHRLHVEGPVRQIRVAGS